MTPIGSVSPALPAAPGTVGSLTDSPSISSDVGSTASYATLNSTFLPTLLAAVAGGDAVNDYFSYRSSKAQSLAQLFTDIGIHPFVPDVEGDGTPIMVAQSGDAAARIRIDVVSSQLADDGSGTIVYNCVGTVALLSGTDMHSKTVTILTITSLGLGLLISGLQAIGLQVITNIFTSCVQAGAANLAAGGEAAEMGMEAGVELAVQDGAEEAVVAEAAGEAIAVEVVAAGATAATFAGPIAAGLGLVATMLTVLLQKSMVHWLDIYNLTDMNLTVSQPWDQDASWGLKPQPAVIPPATKDALGQENVSYTSFMSQNSNGFAGYQYMVELTSDTGALGNLLTTINIPFSEDNSMALDPVAANIDYDQQWNDQTRLEQTQVTLDIGKYKAVLTMNGLNGQDEKYMSVLYIIDPDLFPNFVVPAASV